MANWLDRFGLGRRTGIGFANERAGLVGTPEWSERVRKQPWYPGEAVSVSIGQGPVVATSLQLARGFAALANGGSLVTPHLVHAADVPPGEHLGLDPEHLALVRSGLRRVVAGSEGTARVLGRLPVAGKTGTAQVVSLQEGVDVEDMPYRLRHHAWFVGWAPVDEPSLVVVVLVEHGGGGGSVAAPIARTIFSAALD
jgi:penicillin-binding protein 2